MNPTNSTIERLLAEVQAVNLEGASPDTLPLEEGTMTILGQVTDEFTKKLWIHFHAINAEVKAAKDKLSAETVSPQRAFLGRLFGGPRMSRQEFSEAIEKAMNPEPTPEDLALAVRSSEADVLRGLFWASVYDQIPKSAEAECVGMYGDWQIVLPPKKKAESPESAGGDGDCDCPSCTIGRALSAPWLDVRFMRL